MAVTDPSSQPDPLEDDALEQQLDALLREAEAREENASTPLATVESAAAEGEDLSGTGAATTGASGDTSGGTSGGGASEGGMAEKLMDRRITQAIAGHPADRAAKAGDSSKTGGAPDSASPIINQEANTASSSDDLTRQIEALLEEAGHIGPPPEVPEAPREVSQASPEVSQASPEVPSQAAEPPETPEAPKAPEAVDAPTASQAAASATAQEEVGGDDDQLIHQIDELLASQADATAIEDGVAQDDLTHDQGQPADALAVEDAASPNDTPAAADVENIEASDPLPASPPAAAATGQALESPEQALEQVGGTGVSPISAADQQPTDAADHADGVEPAAAASGFTATTGFVATAGDVADELDSQPESPPTDHAAASSPDRKRMRLPHWSTLESRLFDTCAVINRPLDRFPPAVRQGVGWVAVATTLNGIFWLSYGLFF